MSETKTELPYTNLYTSTYSAVDAGILKEVPNASRQWLEWVSRRYLEVAVEYGDEEHPEILDDVCTTALLLKSFEKGTPGNLEFSEEEFGIILSGFIWGMKAELLRRDGILEPVDDLSIWDDNGTWRLTEKGRLEAEDAAKNPQVLPGSSSSDSPSE